MASKLSSTALVIVAVCLAASCVSRSCVGCETEELETVANVYVNRSSAKIDMKKLIVKECESKDVEACKNDPFYSEFHGEFCDCDFYVVDMNSPGCFTSSRVIKKCDGEDCDYIFQSEGVGGCD